MQSASTMMRRLASWRVDRPLRPAPSIEQTAEDSTPSHRSIAAMAGVNGSASGSRSSRRSVEPTYPTATHGVAGSSSSMPCTEMGHASD
jgi:hypothetical protein